MFGGTCFMLNGNMCVGVHERSLILRVGEERAAVLLQQPHVRPMDLTGKVMRGWATVQPEAIERDEDLRRYAALARDFVGTLPPKEQGARGMRARRKPARE